MFFSFSHASCAGLTRASIWRFQMLLELLDCRVKPGNDESIRAALE
jgi:hypothetical protein